MLPEAEIHSFLLPSRSKKHSSSQGKIEWVACQLCVQICVLDFKREDSGLSIMSICTEWAGLTYIG